MKACWSLFLILVSFLPAFAQDQDFRNYWNKGQAELTRYSLEQERYGEIHKGEAVLIFVTEPFLKDKQVKYESGDRSNAISVLKLNFTRKFYTGIYPYSVMTSTFTPVDFKKLPTLKVTNSNQEWCGHTFTQLNRRGNNYQAESRSYFQAEGDRDFEVKGSWLEEEIWTRLRLDPDSLPTGEFEMIPALQISRLRHQELKPARASAAFADAGKNRKYTVQYKELQRTLSITFNKDFPYDIVSWEDSYPGGFRDNAPVMTTRAVRTNSLKLDYWNHNSVEDAGYRKKLGLTQW